MGVDIDPYVDKCVKCAQHKSTVPRLAPILEYPPPDRPWDVVSIDLIELPATHQGPYTQNLLPLANSFQDYQIPAINNSLLLSANSYSQNLSRP